MSAKSISVFITGLFFLPLSWSEFANAGSVLDLQENSTTSEGDQFLLVTLNAKVGGEYLLQFKSGENFQLSPARGVNLSLVDRTSILVNSNSSSTKDLFENFTCVELTDKAKIQAAIKAVKDESYVRLCNGTVFVHRQTVGYESATEKAANYLRDSWGQAGDGIVNFYKEHRLDQGVEAEISDEHQGSTLPIIRNYFKPAQLAAEKQKIKIQKSVLDIQTTEETGSLTPGQWYQAKNFREFSVSILTPEMIESTILKSNKDRVGTLQPNESKNLVYLVAWPIDSYNMGWSKGVTEPQVAWSERAVGGAHENKFGPDGFAQIAPLISAAKVRPDLAEDTIATFSGGFQRKHGAFKWGPMSLVNNATHYGFIENGVLMSSLQPGLMTMYMDQHGNIDLRVWGENTPSVNDLTFARQNGVALVEGGSDTTVGEPGRYVNNWGFGNWSGSAEKALYTPRSGACIVRDNDKTYMIYAYFTATTPNAMARVFQAYGCDDAIHLDMNSAAHAYFALNKKITENGKSHFHVEHLVKEMAGSDHIIGKERTPRYLYVSDFRDFFYLYTK